MADDQTKDDIIRQQAELIDLQQTHLAQTDGLNANQARTIRQQRERIVTLEAACGCAPGEAPADITRLRRRFSDIVRILREVYSEISDEFDVNDGSYGEPVANRWMSVGTHLAFSIRCKTGIDITTEDTSNG